MNNKVHFSCHDIRRTKLNAPYGLNLQLSKCDISATFPVQWHLRCTIFPLIFVVELDNLIVIAGIERSVSHLISELS
jgi:hypothetical protein